MLNLKTQMLNGIQCRVYDFLGNGNCIMYQNRVDVCAYRTTFAYSLLLCNEGSLEDITGAAVTQIAPFSGSHNQLASPCDRECESVIEGTVLQFFDTPTLSCV
jgi:hypothetical protein